MSAKKISRVLPLLAVIFTFILTTVAQNSNQTLLYEIYPFIRVYTNGKVQRLFGTDYVPPSTDPTTGVQSKDVLISKMPNLSVRIFLPKIHNNTSRLPVLVYFHGGAFFVESAFSPTYHHHLNTIVSRANVIAVSVNYRLAPEHPLPIAYEDSWLALKWTISHHYSSGTDSWLKSYADFNRVCLGGDSSGANIAQNMAIRVGLEKPDPTGIRIVWMFLNCPYFWGKKAIGNESAYSYSATLEKIWLYAYPKTTGLDDPLVNPGMDPNLRKLGCKRVLVFTAGKDILRFRGWYYKQKLERSGWTGIVKALEFNGEDHVFVLSNSTTPNALALLRNLAYFLNH